MLAGLGSMGEALKLFSLLWSTVNLLLIEAITRNIQESNY
jgi:hypothetical protein